ncbi:ubiquitin-conjugating enzyme/RWD-like protein [Chytriomyces sp. MP71]|nr:ubiquitin-conjugating enzyme/RWD-like protein [Chytriomyces sp. MP71]
MLTRARRKCADKNLQETQNDHSEALRVVREVERPKTYTELMQGETFCLVPSQSLWTAAANVSAIKSRHTGSMKYILKETAAFATLLPCHESASIYARAEEGNIDKWKIIITGPLGTPYAYGCFEFHAAMPTSYPAVPPQVTFVTTSQGRMRFNPNLYHDGRVCLSVLNTWDGTSEQRWQPHKSTLLQVLVSLQSLVLVEHPYFNEPGYASGIATAATNPNSIAYNRNIELATVRHAILGQLQTPPIGGGLAKVIRNHFFLVKEGVKAQVRAWAKLAPSNATIWNTLIAEVDVELDKLQQLE